MNDAPSLEKLHDIVLPGETPWWPPAPAWYAVIALAVFLAGSAASRAWRSWRANAYRREALEELSRSEDATAIVETLRRVSLVIAPRASVSDKNGEAWLAWLNELCDSPIPADVREQLEYGAYRRPSRSADIEPLREYAMAWVRLHHSPVKVKG